jgi:hypothetical protein
MTTPDPATVALAWHDVTCPEGPDCRDRPLHSMADAISNTGLLLRFLERLKELTTPQADQTDQDIGWPM